MASSEKIIHVFANDIEFNYVSGDTSSNGNEKKERSISKFRSIEELYGNSSSSSSPTNIKTKSKKRNNVTNNDDKQKQKRIKFINAIEAIIDGKEIKEVENIARTENIKNEDDNVVVLNNDKTSNDEKKQRATEATEYNNDVVENNSVNEE